MNLLLSPSDSQTESALINSLNEYTRYIEANPHALNFRVDSTLISPIQRVLDFPYNEQLLTSIFNFFLALVKINPNYCFIIIDQGLYYKFLSFMNPDDINPAISLNVSIIVRNIIMQMGKHDIVFRNPKFNYLRYGLFLNKIFEFPLSEQKSILQFTRNLSDLFLFDANISSIIEVCPLLTHTDLKIVSDSIQILVNYIKKYNLAQLKIIDPIISQYISIGLYVITDENLIFFLTDILAKLVCISYEHAEELIKLPIDFGIIISKLGVDPSSDVIDNILKIIKQIFSYNTLRKSDTRKEEISKFAFYVQPILINVLTQNLGDACIALDCLLVTFDVYFPLNEMNKILDSVIHILSAGNKKIKIDSLYKKIIENSKVKDGINQYNSLNISKQNSFNLNDLKSFIEIKDIHSSNFVLSEPLQISILSFLKNISSSQIIEKSLSNNDYKLFKKSLLKVVEICQKMIVFNTPKQIKKLGSAIFHSQPKMTNFTIYDTSGNSVNLSIPDFLSLTICESFFNFIHGNNQGTFTHLPQMAVDLFSKVVALNALDKFIDLDHIDDPRISLLNHVLCYQFNEMFQFSRSLNPLLVPSNINTFIGNTTSDFKFYKIRAEGKIYSVFDNLADVIKQTKNHHFEMLNVPKYSRGIREAEFFCRKDIKNHSSISQINFNAFHKSFIYAYPTIFMQRMAFDYMQVAPIPHIETSLQTLKEIHRLFPHLSNNDNNDNNNDNNDNGDDGDGTRFAHNVFENEAFALRLLDKASCINKIDSTISSALIGYPFIFPLESRILFLKITSMSVFRSIYTLASEIFIKLNKPFVPLIRMGFNINRNDIFNDGMVVFNLLSPGGFSFVIKFIGENGMGSGPTQEFFRLFALQMQKNSHDIWLSDKQNDGGEKELDIAHRFGESGLFPSPLAVRRPDLFFTLGALCAKAIEMEISLPIHFSPAFFKLIRGEKIDIKEVSKQYSNVLGLEDKSGLIGLTFTLPGRPDIELRNGGTFVVTDDGNVDLYIELMKRILTFNVNVNDKEEKEEEENIEASSPFSPKASNAWGSLQRVMSSTISTQNETNQESSSSQNSHISSVASMPVYHNNNILNSPSNSPSTAHQEQNSGVDDRTSESYSSESVEIPIEIANFIQRYSFDCCASMFKEGFGRVIPWSSMNLFTAEEICLLIEGEVDLSIENLREFVDVGTGFNFDSPMIVWLFQILSSELSAVEKKLFARFVTGSDSFGVFGLKSLKPRLSITKTEKNEDSLPSASTCTNCLKLPEYSTKELLKKKLLYALYECNETFYLS